MGSCNCLRKEDKTMTQNFEENQQNKEKSQAEKECPKIPTSDREEK